MKKFLALAGLLALLLVGCAPSVPPADIVATTLPVYEFTTRLCDGTGLTVSRLVTENVSCLHDYSLNVDQVRATEAAELIILSGAGLEDFMDGMLSGKNIVDASAGLELLENCHGHHEEHADHQHEHDAHIWLSPENARMMAANICAGLVEQYPAHRAMFETNLAGLLTDIDALQTYAQTQLQDLSCRQIITFHDGFAYMADAFDLTILQAIEEESGSEASAAELKQIISSVQEHGLTAVFVEKSGSVSAAGIISAETGATVYTLDMAMSGESWFEAMYRNIDTLREALQ